VPQILNTLSRLLEPPRGLLTADDLNALDGSARCAMLELKVLAPAKTARHVVCDQCHDGHVEEVSRVLKPDGDLGFFISCPEAGWVPVDPDRLRQWKPDVSRLALLLAEAVGAGNSAEVILRDSAWRLGEITIAGGVYGVFLICPNEHGVADLASGLRKKSPPESSILVLANDTPLATNEFAAAVPLCAAFQYEDGRLELDGPRLRSSLRTDIARPDFVFRRSGHYWVLTFDGETKHLKDSVGMAYTARLLAEPLRDIPAVSLLAARAGIDPQVAAGSTGEMLDEQARKAYQNRYNDLVEDLAEAEKNNDSGNIERLQAEMDQLATELAGATGLGGRSRAKTDAEKVRKSVSMAVSRAIESIQTEHESLGRHLTASITSGLVFRYSPETPIDWLT